MPGDSVAKKANLPDFCRSLPVVTEDIKWGKDLVFSVGGKMFACFDSGDLSRFSFKTTPAGFDMLTSKAGIIPAPYVARYHWVAVENSAVLSQELLQEMMRESYDLVVAKLPKKVRRSILENN